MRRSIVLVFAFGAAMTLASSARALPSFDEVRAGFRTSETRVVDRHGEVVQVVRTDPTVRRLAWTPIADVSPALRTALVLSEDRRFYEHAGVDWRAVGSAAWGNLVNTRTRGASTITMQLAGLVDADLRAAAAGRTIGQKVSQAVTAFAMERSWKKDQILEAYLNLVGYRGELVGVGALSATLFEKYPSGLDAREAAITAALVRAPNAPAARVAERACAILREESLPEECRGLDGYTALVLARKASPRLDDDPQVAPHFARAVLRATSRSKEARPPVVATTLDARLQRFVRETLRRQLAELAGRNVEDGAAIVVDNATGEVLAWVGSSGDLSSAADVDHVLAPRQAGSTLKPFLYELAIEKRWLTAASILVDAPVDLATANGLYIPQNYDHAFRGPVSVRTALASSLNVPAVRTVVMVTPERFHQRLRRLGFSTLRESGDYYGYALALGSAEVTLADLANAYRALANGGVASPLRVVPGGRPTDTTRAMEPGPSAIVADILADPIARTTTFGLDSVLSTRRWSAVKTGTSKDLRDNWCVGFTDRYTVGVWVGNSHGESMWDVSGTTGAAPVWRAIVDALDDRGAPRSPASAGPSVVRQAIRFDGDLEAPRDEWFVAGTETTRMARSAASATAGTTRAGGAGPVASVDPRGARGGGAILQPVDGTILALDPDIPPTRQRLTLRRADAATGTRWRLDDRIVGAGPSIEWSLWPGRHRVELVDANGAVVDRVGFEVRGAETRDGARSPVRN